MVTVSPRSSKMLRIFGLCQCSQLLQSQNAVKKACHPVEAVGQQHNIMIKCTVGFRLGSRRYRETDYICESGKITQQCLTSPSPLPLYQPLGEKVFLLTTHPHPQDDLWNACFPAENALADCLTSPKKKSLEKDSCLTGHEIFITNSVGRKAKKMVQKSLTIII